MRSIKEISLAAIVIILLDVFGPRVFAETNADFVATNPYLLFADEEHNSQSTECTLGDAVSDAARIYTNADIAIICGGDLIANLPSGGLSHADIMGVFAADRALATATVSIAELREILEAGLSHIILDDSEKIDLEASAYPGFPQISGFTLYYDASRKAGSRVTNIIIGDHEEDINSTEITITLAATLFMFEGGYDMPQIDNASPAGLTLTDVMENYLNDGALDYSNPEKRIIPNGTSGVFVTGSSIAGIVIVAFILSKSRKARGLKRFSNFER